MRTLFIVTNDVWALDMSEDGSIYAGVGEYPGDVVRLSPAGGPMERLGGFPRIPDHDFMMVLPDGRAVVPARISGHVRLMVVANGKQPAPLINTMEETRAPLTLAGERQIAFAIGAEPPQAIAVAEIETGRILHRIIPGKGPVDSLSSSPDGHTLYFAAAGNIWSVEISGGEPRKITSGDSVVMEPGHATLLVQRTDPVGVRLFNVPLDGAPEREVSIDRSFDLFGWPLSSGAVGSRDRVLVSLTPRGSWFNPLGILDPRTGRIQLVPADELTDHHSGGWTRDGHIIALQRPLHAALWNFTPQSPASAP